VVNGVVASWLQLRSPVTACLTLCPTPFLCEITDDLMLWTGEWPRVSCAQTLCCTILCGVYICAGHPCTLAAIDLHPAITDARQCSILGEIPFTVNLPGCWVGGELWHLQEAPDRSHLAAVPRHALPGDPAHPPLLFHSAALLTLPFVPFIPYVIHFLGYCRWLKATAFSRSP
jgi:hypothetical protein